MLLPSRTAQFMPSTFKSMRSGFCGDTFSDMAFTMQQRGMGDSSAFNIALLPLLLLLLLPLLLLPPLLLPPVCAHHSNSTARR